MASSDNDEEAFATPSKRKGGSAKKSGNDKDVWNHAVYVIVIALLGVFTALGVAGWQLVEQANLTNQRQHIENNTNSFVGVFNGRIATLGREFSALAGSSIARDALVSGDEEALSRASEQLASIMAYARRVDVIPKGRARVDLQAETAISFAALDVIKRAETEEFVGPEATINQRGLVYAAKPVTHDGVVVGVVFAAFANSYFLEPLDGYSETGTVRIDQTFEGSPPTSVMQWGIGGQQDLASESNLAAPHWKLVYLPDPNKLPTAAQWTSLLAPLAVAAGLLLGGVWLGFARLANKLTIDADTLTNYAAKLVRGRSTSLDRYKTVLFRRIARELSIQTPGTSPDQGGPKRSRKAASTTSADPAGVADLLSEDDEPVLQDPVGDLLADEDDDFLEVSKSDKKNTNHRKTGKKKDDNFGIEVTEETSLVDVEIDPEIFRAYDIRGITNKNLTEEVIYWIGRAFAAEALVHGQTRIALGCDGRHSSPAFVASITRGLTEGGCDVADIGQVPTPMLYYATHALDTGTGVMITGSHNPPEYNGVKMVLAGEALSEARILQLHRRILENRLSDGSGDVDNIDITQPYLERIVEDVAVAQPLKVVVDCGNGVAGRVAPKLLQELGCEVVPLYCDVDGDFPNHHPDPADPANLEDLKTVVRAELAHLGLAFDGDGDRLGVVTPKGQIVWPDKLMMLFAQDVVSRNPGADIIYDVKCSRHLNNLISEYGGRPIMWKTGHSNIKAKMKETGALLGGEFSGHICFSERWYGFDDALYSAARLMEILGAQNDSVDALFAKYPQMVSTPELKINTTEADKFKFIEQLKDDGDFGDGTVTSIDGIRVDYADGWGLVRPSNTSPVLSLRFEADNTKALERIQAVFQTQLGAVDRSLTFL